jgi:hypothetical protein
LSLSNGFLAALVISAIIVSAMPVTEASVQVIPGGSPITFRLDDADINWQISYNVESIMVTEDTLEFTELTGDVYAFSSNGTGAEISVLLWAPHAVRGKVLSFSLDSGTVLLNLTGMSSGTYDLYRDGRLVSGFTVVNNCGELNVSGAGTLWDVVIKSSSPGTDNAPTDDSPGNVKVTAGPDNLWLIVMIMGSSVMIVGILVVKAKRRR